MIAGLLALAGGILFAAAPAGMIPRNEVERLVLARPESASRELEAWLAAHPQERERALTEAGFKRVRAEDACGNYVYTRRFTDTLDRGASVILCDGKPPFVMRFDASPGPFSAPAPGAPGFSIPKPR